MDETYLGSGGQPGPAEKLAQEFALEHPSIGEIIADQPLTPERLSALAILINNKILELSRLPHLDERQRAFINRALDIAARCNIYWLERYNADLGGAPDTAHMLNRIRMHMGVLQGRGTPSVVYSTEELMADKVTLIQMLGTLSGGRVSIDRLNQVNRTPVEELARNVVALMPQIAEANQEHEPAGLPIDRYLKGNIDDLIANYHLLKTAG